MIFKLIATEATTPDSQMLARLGVIFALTLGLQPFRTLVTTASASELPNIVVFLTDDLGQLDSTPYGATDVQTPNMAKLAKDGMLFSHAFVASPACAPSRAAFLTGLMPARNGAEANHSYKREGITSLTTNLKRLGYELAAFGKVAHGKDAANHGFDTFQLKFAPSLVSDFLQSRVSSKPLCLFVGTQRPHVPWPTIEGYDPSSLKLPPTFIDTPVTREFRARYYTEVTKADASLGDIRSLSEQFLGDKTLFVFSSDHGAQWPFGKWNLYDAGIAIPLIVSWQGIVKSGSHSGAMAQWTDILPTLIDAAGGDVPQDIDGRSFLPILRGRSDTHRDVIFTTHSGDGQMNVYPIRAIRTERWKLIWNLHPEFAHTTHIDKALAKDGGRYWTSWFERSQSDESAKEIVRRYHERPEFELFDLQEDPHEQHNLAARPEHAELVASLKHRLEDWMKSQNDQRTVFNNPRLLSDPLSTAPGENADRDASENRLKRKPAGR